MKKILLNETLHKDIFHCAPIPIFWTNRKGAVINANKSAAEHLLYTQDELLNLYISDIDVNFTDERLRYNWELIRTNKSLHVNTIQKRKDGTLVDVNILLFYNVVDEEEYLIAYVIPNQEVYSGEIHLRTIYELINMSEDIIIILNLDMNQISFANKFACKHFNITNEQILGQNIDNLIKVSNSTDKLSEYLTIKNALGTLNFICDTKNDEGTYSIFEAKASCSQINGEHVVVLVLRDISDKIIKDKELNKLNSNLEKKVQERTAELEDIKSHLEDEIKIALEAKSKSEALVFEQKRFSDIGRVISAISHHWRQPLNVLSLLIQELHEQFADDLAPSKEYLELNKHTSLEIIKELSETIDQFRSFYKSNNSKSEFHVIDCVIDIFKMLKTQLDVYDIKFKVFCKCRQKSFSCENPNEFPDCMSKATTLFGPKDELKLTFINIITNSIESVINKQKLDGSHNGSIEINLSVQKNNIYVCISDNGIIIPEEILDKVFDPYFSTKQDENSVGLGLYMCRHIVNVFFNGRISIDTDQNRNNCKIVIPIS